MRLFNALVYDETVVGLGPGDGYVTSTTTAAVLGEADQLALHVICDSVVGFDVYVSVAIEHSADGVNFVTKNPSTDLLALLSTTESNSFIVGDGGTIPFAAYVRLRVRLLNDVASAQVRIFATGRRTVPGGFNRLDPTLGTCALWLSALDGSSMYTDTGETTPSTNGAAVGRWKDRSGNGRHADQSGAGKPTLDTTGINSRRAVAFAGGATQYLATPAFSIPQPCTIYLVAFTTGGTDYFCDGATGNARALLSFGVTDFSINAGATLSQVIADIRTSAIVAGVFNGASSVCRYNATETTGDAGTATENAGFVLGDYGPITGGAPLSGDIGEVLIYLTAHTAAQRATVQAALKADWGTP